MNPGFALSLPRRLAPAAASIALLCSTSAVSAASHFVDPKGSDGNDCSSRAAACATLGRGIATLAPGDELVVGDGTYAESIKGIPSGSAAASTTVRADHDWGVTIDGSGFADDYSSGIDVESGHYIVVRGFRVKMSQEHMNDEPIAVRSSDHVKIQRCGGSYAPVAGNAATVTVGPMSSFVLVEECYGFGGGRYQFLVYQSDHVVVRRSVARNDYWNGSLECAGFTNYDSLDTAWQNDVALDSDDANCSGHLFGGFFNENKTDTAPDTSESHAGNIVFNVQAFYAGDLDWVASGTHTIEDTIVWGSSGGYWGNQGDGVPVNIEAKHLTFGQISGRYDGPNGGAARGTGFSVFGDVQNSLTSSLFYGCASLGVADYTKGDFNAFFGNGQDYGGAHQAAVGPHDRSAANQNAIDPKATQSLRWLPRVEKGSPLAKAGEDGGRAGAEVLFEIGKSGTLWGEPGWNTVTTEPLWPFPNEDVIGTEMASYEGPGAPGVRGFTAGESLDGTPQTLTKYVWEALGNEIPSDVYGFHVAVASLPDGALGEAYEATIAVGGGAKPYAWKLAGDLPPGLALDPDTGVVSGKPTKVGTFSFTAEVSDADAPPATVKKALAIKILSHLPDDGDDGGDGGCGCVVGRASEGGLALLGIVLLVLARWRQRSRTSGASAAT